MSSGRVGTKLSAVMMSACVAVAGWSMPTPASAADDLLERGRYLVETVAFCGVCHATRGPDGRILPGKELAGGGTIHLEDFRTIIPNIPPGEIRAVVPNITPDVETGIGRWKDLDIATAIREGLRPDGSIIGPPMPVTLYRGLSDRDLTAMVRYLRSIPPVPNAVDGHSNYPFSLTSYGPPVGHVSDPSDNPVERGAYIAGPLAHCIDCHTPPTGVVERDWSRTGAGGVPFVRPWGAAVASNITPDKDIGIGSWTDEQILAAITQGVDKNGRRLAPPMSNRAPVYSHIAQRDLTDLVAYLRSLPPRQ